MARIWPVYEGKEPTHGGPWAELSISEAVELFELNEDSFISDNSKAPRFGHIHRDLSYLGYKHIVVEIEPREARLIEWKPGFYRSPIKPNEAFERLIKQSIAAVMGSGNIVRVEHQPGSDSRGRDAIRITVVIDPAAIGTLREGAALDALVSLQRRLNEMRDDRTPLVQYATEAELAQDVAS